MTAAILSHLWQSTLFAVLAALLTLALRKNSARVRYWVWFAASAKFLIPFSLLTWLGGLLSWRTAPAEADAVPALMQTLAGIASLQVSAGPSTAVAAASTSSLDLVAIAIGVWILGCVGLAVRWLASWTHVAQALRGAKRLPLNVPAVVKSSVQLHEPVVAGIVKPVLLIPEGITAKLSPAQLRAVLAHELCHLRHRDNLTAAIHMLVEVLFWFHPLVWWIGARMIDERERACDEAVLASGNEPQRYAEGILKVCQFYLESKVPCAAGVSGANLKQRVEAIMMNRTITTLTSARKVLLAGAASFAIVAPFAVGLATGTPGGFVQAPVAFDTVSIQRSEGKQQMMMLMTEDGKLRIRGLSLRRVVAFAYGKQPSLVLGGPAWLDEVRYDIEATSSVATDPKRDHELYQGMTRALLAKEFRLIAHTETQQPSGFVLRVDQGGSKMEQVAANAGGAGMMGMKLEKDGLVATRTPMSIFVHHLSTRLKQPVLDQTGLSGAYNFTLKSSFNVETLPADLRGQLGLSLEKELVSQETVVIDAATEPTL
jgi:bla regulator protein blaR1